MSKRVKLKKPLLDQWGNPHRSMPFTYENVTIFCDEQDICEKCTIRFRCLTEHEPTLEEHEFGYRFGVRYIKAAQNCKGKGKNVLDRTCNHCKVKLTNENWSESAQKASVHNCKECAKKVTKEYREKNKAKINKERKLLYQVRKTYIYGDVSIEYMRQNIIFFEEKYGEG